jgi:hypothetical protein
MNAEKTLAAANRRHLSLVHKELQHISADAAENPIALQSLNPCLLHDDLPNLS